MSQRPGNFRGVWLLGSDLKRLGTRVDMDAAARFFLRRLRARGARIIDADGASIATD